MKNPPRAQMRDEILAATAVKDRLRVAVELAGLTNITARWKKVAAPANSPASVPKKRGAPRKDVGAWWLRRISELKFSNSHSKAGSASDAWRDATDDRQFVESFYAVLKSEWMKDRELGGAHGSWFPHIDVKTGKTIVFDLREKKQIQTELTQQDIRSRNPKGVVVLIQQDISSICKAMSTERKRLRDKEAESNAQRKRAPRSKNSS